MYPFVSRHQNFLQLCPKFIFARCSHLTTALWASVEIPSADVHTAALRTQPPSLTVERRSDLADYSPDHNVLYRMTVAALYCDYLLLKQSTAFIQFNLIAAQLAS
jgi:hypothetical protein